MSFDLVLFGGTGDLAWRKLMPALFQAFRHGTLPAGGRIIGVARDDLSDQQYRALIRSRFDAVDLAKRPSPEEFERFAGCCISCGSTCRSRRTTGARGYGARAQCRLRGDVPGHRAQPVHQSASSCRPPD
jgi:glucose-6-phosphate 1-dehydrogenase